MIHEVPLFPAATRTREYFRMTTRAACENANLFQFEFQGVPILDKGGFAP